VQALLKGEKLRQKDLCTDLMLAASLKMGKLAEEDPAQSGHQHMLPDYQDGDERILALVLTVDI